MLDALLLAHALGTAEAPAAGSTGHRLAAVTCFPLSQEISTRTRICFYTCNGTKVAITIERNRLCPQTIEW